MSQRSPSQDSIPFEKLELGKVSLSNRRFLIKGAQCDTVALIKACLDEPPKGGFNLAEMRARLSVHRAVDESASHFSSEKEDIVLNEEQLDTLRECARKMSWSVLHPEILNFMEELEK